MHSSNACYSRVGSHSWWGSLGHRNFGKLCSPTGNSRHNRLPRFPPYRCSKISHGCTKIKNGWYKCRKRKARRDANPNIKDKSDIIISTKNAKHHNEFSEDCLKISFGHTSFFTSRARPFNSQDK
jgi:hypothetical protein